ncbi:MAG: integrase arm-type DNA-binding domain-containing protein [Myxococcota bacterium]
MRGGNDRLSDRAVRAWLKNPDRAPNSRLSDGHGLFLRVTPKGTPLWLMKYRRGPKDTLISFGAYPEIGLKEARARRAAARELIRQGRDPVLERKVNRAEAIVATGNTFAECAAVWLEKRQPGWSPAHYSTVSETLARHVLPHLGPLPIAEVSQRLVAGVVERLGDRIDTAQKVRQICAGVFRLAQAQGKFVGDNPADAAREVIARRKLRGRRPAFVTWPELGGVLRGAEKANLSSAVRVAHRLCAFTAARMGNVIAAEWSEFQLEADPPMWVIPRAKMKAQDRHFDHRVVLGPVIAGEIRAWHLLNGSPTSGFVFPAVAGNRQHITHESIEKSYRVTLGLKDKHTPHGWRSALSTLARDHGFARDVVEMALDHVHDNDVVRAYDRGERLPERVRLAAWWNEQLAKAQRGEQ